MSDSKCDTSQPILARPFKPATLLEGVSVDEIRSLPKVKSLLERVVSEARQSAYDAAFKEGRESAYAAAFEEYSSNLNLEISKVVSEFSSELGLAISALKQPLSSLQVEVESELRNTFNDCLKAVVSEPSAYDHQLSKLLQQLLESLPSNNRILSISLRSGLPLAFKEHFDRFGVEIQCVEMEDLLRVQTSSASFRVNPLEFAESIIKG